ncbi:hypothetical protein RB636_11860 [Streptomyces chrestomyceticus]|uniref:Uncharacterized protein n=1 Tax=Streptomyces chrestomyceticus TaxID=68185 RepID=A0ABU7WR32_9ACTN
MGSSLADQVQGGNDNEDVASAREVLGNPHRSERLACAGGGDHGDARHVGQTADSSLEGFALMRPQLDAGVRHGSCGPSLGILVV